MRTSVFLAGILPILLLPSFAQQNAGAQSSSTADTPTTPAILYSEMQAPVPEPAGQIPSEPIPPSQQQQPEDRPAPGRPHSQPGTESAPNNPQEDNASSLTGTILKDGDQFVLSTQGNVNFQLDDQERASKFAGVRVKVTGGVDPSKRKIRVEKIEPLV